MVRETGSSSRLGGDLELVRSEDFRGLCRTSPTDFTRNRKLPCDVLVESVLSKRGRGIRLDVRQLWKEGLLEDQVSASALSRARRKLNPEAIRSLATHHARQVYEDGDYATWHGMIPVGVDGSSVDVHTNEETLEKWGNASNEGARPQAQAGLSTAFDPINRQIADVTIKRCAFDERAEVRGHAEVCRDVFGGEPFCMLMDRGYPSFDVLAGLIDDGVHFVCRCPKNFLRPEFERCAREGGDIWVDVRITRDRARGLRDSERVSEEEYEALIAREPLHLRFVLVDVGGDEPERLVTDLPAPGDPELPDGVGPVTADDLREGYHLRWGSETCYRFEKQPLEISNLSGRSPIVIEQDIYATAYLYNLAFDIANDADGQLEESGSLEGYKHEMTVNRTYAIGAMKDELVAMVLADDADRAAIMDGIVSELKGQLVPVRPGRSYSRVWLEKRKGKGKGRKRQHNDRYKKAF